MNEPLDKDRPIWLEPAVVVVWSADYVIGEGWRCRLRVRREGLSWEASGQAVHYSHLSASELLDVAGADLETALAPRRRPNF